MRPATFGAIAGAVGGNTVALSIITALCAATLYVLLTHPRSTT